MSGKLKLTVACGDYEIVRALKEGAVAARRHRACHAHRHGPARAPLAHGAQGRVRHLRGQCRRLLHGARPRRAADRHPGLPAPPLPPRLRVRQRRRRHQDAEGPDRQADRRHQFPAGPNIWMRGILEEHYGVPHRQRDLGGRARGGRAVRDAEGSAHRDDRAGQAARRHAGGRRIPAMLSPTLPRRSCRATSASCGCFPTTRRSSSTISRRPASSRSCTSRRSSRRSSTNIPGCRPTWSRRSRRRRTSPIAASPTRAWCRSPGSAPRGRSRRRCSAPTRGPTAYGPANRKNLETIQRYARQQGLISRRCSLDELFVDTDLGDAGGPDEVLTVGRSREAYPTRPRSACAHAGSSRMPARRCHWTEP